MKPIYLLGVALILAGCMDFDGDPPPTSSLTTGPGDEVQPPLKLFVNDTFEVQGANLGAAPRGMFVGLPGNTNCAVLGAIPKAGLHQLVVTATAGEGTGQTLIWDLIVSLPFAADGSKDFRASGNLPLTVDTGNLSLGNAEQANVYVQPGQLPPSASVRATVHATIIAVADQPSLLTVDLGNTSCSSS
jgi:hypothetical protein